MFPAGAHDGCDPMGMKVNGRKVLGAAHEDEEEVQGLFKAMADEAFENTDKLSRTGFMTSDGSAPDITLQPAVAAQAPAHTHAQSRVETETTPEARHSNDDAGAVAGSSGEGADADADTVALRKSEGDGDPMGMNSGQGHMGCGVGGMPGSSEQMGGQRNMMMNQEGQDLQQQQIPILKCHWQQHSNLWDAPTPQQMQMQLLEQQVW